jgi:hypothetical protein
LTHSLAPRPACSHVPASLTLSQFLLVKEYITYTPTAGGGVAQPCGTQFSQRALIQAGNLGLAAVARKVEGWSVSRFGSNAAKGKLGIEEVLRNMWSNASAQASGGARL